MSSKYHIYQPYITYQPYINHILTIDYPHINHISNPGAPNKLQILLLEAALLQCLLRLFQGLVDRGASGASVLHQGPVEAIAWTPASEGGMSKPQDS